MTPNLRGTSGRFLLRPSTSSEKFYTFDIETNGLLNKGSDSVSQIWCLVIQDINTGEVFQYPPDQVEEGLNKLKEADALIGHNIIFYDIPVICHLFPEWEYHGQYIDTFIFACLVYPKETLYDLDEVLYPHVPPKLKGSQSLKAWGSRLKNLKDEYSDWTQYTPQMLEYNKQDVLVTTDLFKYLTQVDYSQIAVALEHDIAQVLSLQVCTGWTFDVDAALDLDQMLEEKQQEIGEKLTETIPPQVKEEVFIPKRDNKTRGYIAGQPFVKSKEIPFNPSSRDHCITFFKEKYNWIPTEVTEKGHPKLDDDILQKLPYPEAQMLAEYMLVVKRRGQISQGKNAWLKYATDEGKIHGGITPNGTLTGRSSHQSPNVAQIPAARSPYGKECRALFSPPQGYIEMGSDAKALELRCLAGYLAIYDGGDYITQVIDPTVDIHVYNQNLFGVETRDLAKTLIYCFPVECTEVKTVKGWKKYEELELGELVYAFDIQEAKLVETPIRKIIHPYPDHVVRYLINREFYFECTPEHRWIVQRADGKTLVPASTLRYGDKLVYDVVEKSGVVTTKKITILHLTSQLLGQREVFCISTDYETFVVRQRGRGQMITGNCVVYGGGPGKVGATISPLSSIDEQKQIGYKTLDRFYKELPAVKQLKDDIEKVVKGRGYLKGIDGRKLHIRESYKALNVLLQSAGALIMKRVGIEIYEGLIDQGLEYDRDFVQLASIHDEYQHGILPDHLELAKSIILDSYVKGGEYFNFKCPIMGDVKTGANWLECHD
jgi:DNA polymerase I